MEELANVQVRAIARALGQVIHKVTLEVNSLNGIADSLVSVDQNKEEE